MKIEMRADLMNIIRNVLPIVQQAGIEIMNIYNENEDAEITYKEDNSPLTLADKASNSILCDGLDKMDVRFPIISEENNEILYADRKDYEYYWLLDPLDGTKEFIKRNGEFTVNVALIHKGRSVASVVGIPAVDALYFAVLRSGAYRIVGSSELQLQASFFSFQDAGLRIVCSRSHLNEETGSFVNRFDNPVLLPKGSSLKFLSIAEGDADMYPRLAPTMEWDTAAAQIILEEAGGSVLQSDNGLAMEYNKENLLNPSFIAYGVHNSDER